MVFEQQQCKHFKAGLVNFSEYYFFFLWLTLISNQNP